MLMSVVVSIRISEYYATLQYQNADTNPRFLTVAGAYMSNVLNGKSNGEEKDTA